MRKYTLHNLIYYSRRAVLQVVKATNGFTALHFYLAFTTLVRIIKRKTGILWGFFGFFSFTKF
jgi:hypothetical protein